MTPLLRSASFSHDLQVLCVDNRFAIAPANQAAVSHSENDLYC
jgi:hypothetical protein